MVALNERETETDDYEDGEGDDEMAKVNVAGVIEVVVAEYRRLWTNVHDGDDDAVETLVETDAKTKSYLAYCCVKH
jgi:hypothetical protein